MLFDWQNQPGLNAFQTKMWRSNLIKFRANTKNHLKKADFSVYYCNLSRRIVIFYVAGLEVPLEMSVKLAVSETQTLGGNQW